MNGAETAGHAALKDRMDQLEIKRNEEIRQLKNSPMGSPAPSGGGASIPGAPGRLGAWASPSPFLRSPFGSPGLPGPSVSPANNPTLPVAKTSTGHSSISHD